MMVLNIDWILGTNKMRGLPHRGFLMIFQLTFLLMANSVALQTTVPMQIKAYKVQDHHQTAAIF